jgi:hypothetical protein
MERGPSGHSVSEQRWWVSKKHDSSMTSSSMLPLPLTLETVSVTEHQLRLLLPIPSRFFPPTPAHDQTLATRNNARVSATDQAVQHIFLSGSSAQLRP